MTTDAPKTTTRRLGLHPRRQAGFTLVTAIFLITILFLLAAFMIGFRLYQDASVSLDTLGTRAYAAARAGVEWGAYQSLRNGTCAGAALALDGSLAGYTVTVTCARDTFNEAGITVNIDTIVAKACNDAACPPATPGPNYVERQITVIVGGP
jgi:MSHA biogenesis protein MshP